MVALGLSACTRRQRGVTKRIQLIVCTLLRGRASSPLFRREQWPGVNASSPGSSKSESMLLNWSIASWEGPDLRAGVLCKRLEGGNVQQACPNPEIRCGRMPPFARHATSSSPSFCHRQLLGTKAPGAATPTVSATLRLSRQALPEPSPMGPKAPRHADSTAGRGTAGGMGKMVTRLEALGHGRW